MKFDYDKVYHLSHIDLDGYSCQLITQKVFDNIEFFNSNYGEEIEERLKQIIEQIKKSSEKRILILITDLNLSLDQCNFLEEEINSIEYLENKTIDLLLLDHHKTGEDAAKQFDWYKLDVTKSATLLTYEYFKESGKIEDLKFYVECVNAYDIWLQEQKERFEIGKVLSRYVMSANEINRIMFPLESYIYITSILQKSFPYLDKKDSNIHIELDNSLHQIKKKFFIENKDNTLENLVSDFVVKLLTKNKDKMTVFYKNYKGILTYSISNTSVIGNTFLRANPDYDFFIDINSKKNISMRADNKVDVSLIAKELFEGGGHANASGGRWKDFKDSFIYEKIRKQIAEKLA